MYRQTVSTSSGASDAITVLPANPFNVGFGVVIDSGTPTYKLEHTFDGINWFDHEFITGQTVAQDGNYAFPVAQIRVNITSGSGMVTLTALQARG